MQTIQSDIIDREGITWPSGTVGAKRETVHLPAFDSLAEAISFADAGASANWGEHVASRDDDADGERAKFTGTKSWPACQKLVADGWTEGREKVAANLADIFASGAAELTCGAAVEHAVGGAYPNVPLYVAGEVCHMVNDGDQLGEKPIVKLMVNVSASCGIQAELIANRGAAVAALVDEIESAGHSCEVHVCNPLKATTGSSAGARKELFYSALIQVKTAGEPLAIDDLAFALGHPSMLRRVLFGVLEADPKTDGFGLSDNGYGTPADLPAASLPADAIYLRGLIHEKAPYATAPKAMDTVRAIYNKQAETKGLPIVEGGNDR